MFCTTLRRRSSFASTVPSLTSPTGLSLKESHLSTHDIAVQIPSPGNQRGLRLLLLSSTSTTPSNLPATLSRIHHFASLTGGTDTAIIFALSAPAPFSPSESLVSPDRNAGLGAYTRLQCELLSRADIPWIPILPLANTGGLAEAVSSHVQALGRQRPDAVSGARAVKLLAACTTDAVLSPLAVGVTSDVFPSLAHLASAGSAFESSDSVEGRIWDESDEVVRRDESEAAFGVLEEQLGTEIVSGMLEFWADDWVID